MTIKELQRQVLKNVFRQGVNGLALAGGTALELFYLHHRNSRDLDFFLPRYDEKMIAGLIAGVSQDSGCRIEKGVEFSTPQHARVVFYYLEKAGLETPLKIDFVEEVLIPEPKVNLCDGVRVYAAREIYYHKIFAVAGTRTETDVIGRAMFTGRNAPRDAVDIYYLSKTVCPLHSFLEEIPSPQQHALVRWVRTYSRMDLKIDAQDLEIYDKNFDVNEMIRHIDDETDKFVGAMI